jgi:glucose/arabinose dehydrogenase
VLTGNRSDPFSSFRPLFCAAAFAVAACGGSGDSQPPGSLVVSIEGLPPDVAAEVMLAGPDATIRPLRDSQSIASLPPGQYSLIAKNVLRGSTILAAQQPSRTFAVASGAQARITVTYENAGTLRLELQPVLSGLDQPVFLTAPPGDRRLFIVEKPGRVRIVKDGVLIPTPLLDISSRISMSSERGLLSIAFDPDFARNGFLFVHFTDPTGDIAIERFHITSATPDVVDPDSLRIITVPHRDRATHNGGRVAFGPDGFLYLSLGDGGGVGDPSGNGQNLETLLGKLLRIDVSKATAAQPYAIPANNPFIDQAGRRPEIWAYGLRNPWRFAFDGSGGNVYIADVGQDRFEEVDVMPAASAGLNYGWNRMEASSCYATDPCDKAGLTLPILEYAHDAAGGCSILGGFVYRGNAIPELRGRYLYSDLCSAWLRSFRYDGASATEQTDWNITPPPEVPFLGRVYSFGEDGQGELYVLGTTNVVYKLVQQ